MAGLGADKRVFKNLAVPGYDIFFLEWLKPEKNESLDVYAHRMAAQIKHEFPVLIGLSFGGIMCIELARFIPAKLVIIISSIKNFHEMPYWMRLAGKLRLNKILPIRSFKLIEPLEDYNLGVENADEKDIVHSYRRNVDQQYSDWAINTVLNWKNEWKPEGLFHIHGDKDRIFPVKNVHADVVIPNAGHLMVMNRSEPVNDAINKILSVQVYN